MSIAIGWADYGSVKSEFMFSVINTVKYDSKKRNIISDIIGATASAVSRGKNSVVESFLNTEAEWLLMMDADTIWHEELIYKMYDIANKNKIDVLSAIYFLRPNGEKSSLTPAAYETICGEDFSIDLSKVMDEEIVEVSWAGGGALLISRDAVISSKQISKRGIEFWFKEGIEDDYCGEDYYLFNSLKNSGYKIYCSPQVQIAHIKQVRLNVFDYIEEKELKKQGKAL
jgi:GT2 family glycosyltransferase